MRILAGWLSILVVLPMAACAAERDEGNEAVAVGATSPVTLVAVGDIACPPGAEPTRRTCRQAATARLSREIDPDHVIALGDLQYQRGALRAFRRSYDESWGRQKSITRPVPGNHEYKTDGAAGYDAYFNRDAPEWYAWTTGGWRIYNLDSNCGRATCRAQLVWLADDLEANPHDCTIIATHHPRFSSGEHGSDPGMRRFWRVAYAHRVDIALAGHDHDYERFAPMDPDGQLRPNRGIQSFVSGTGGKSLYSREHNPPGSRFFHARHFGVLALTLHSDAWIWRYRTIDGVVRDSGSRSCV